MAISIFTITFNFAHADLEKSFFGVHQCITEQQACILDIQEAPPISSRVYRVPSDQPIRELLQLPVAAKNKRMETLDCWRYPTSARCENSHVSDLIR